MHRSPIKSFIRSKKPHIDGRTSCNHHLGKPCKVQMESPQDASRMSTHPRRPHGESLYNSPYKHIYVIGLDRLESPTTQNDPTPEIKPTELAERVEHVWIDRSLN